MPSVSAIVLTKDSERTIEACVKALRPAVDHVIVVDTGSSDNTIQIAKENGARVYLYEWVDDFAAARNFGDSLATTEWVIHVDSDEILPIEHVNKLRELCSQYKKTHVPIAVSIKIHNIMGDHIEVAHSPRMYKRGVLTWKGIIHEQLYGRRGEGWYNVSVDVPLVHDGYNPNVVNTHDKLVNRNIRLLKKGIEQDPNNPFYHYFLGRDYTVTGDYASAIHHLEISLNLKEQQNFLYHIEEHYKLLIQCCEKVHDYSGAETIANRMVYKFENYTEGWYKAPAF